MYPGIDEKSYIEGLTQVIQDSSKNFSGVSLLQQLIVLNCYISLISVHQKLKDVISYIYQQLLLLVLH